MANRNKAQEIESSTGETTMAPDQVEKSKNDIIEISRVTFNYVVIAIVFLCVGIIIGAVTVRSMSLDETTLKRVVSDAVAQEVAKIPTQAAVASADAVPTDRFELVDDDPYLGPEDAPVVIVEFSAFACPYCGRHFEQTFTPLLENYGQYIRYVYRDYPVINSSISIPASLAAQCAFEQSDDYFWAYHNMLYANQSSLGEAFFISAAEDIGLDMDEFNACYEEQRYSDEVQNDLFDGQILNISGTPAFYINGTFVSGARPYEQFERLILRELEKAGIDVNADAETSTNS